MLGALLGIGGGLLGGLGGMLGARSEADAARKQEQANREANVLNQAWSGLLGNKERLQENFEKPSVMGGALQGAVGGAIQGMNVYDAMKRSDELNKLKDKLTPMQQAELLTK